MMKVQVSRVMYRWLGVAAACAIASGITIATVSPASAQAPLRRDRWVATWATAVVARASQPAPVAQADQPAPAGRGGQAPPPRFNNQTLRQIVRVSLGGARVRVVLTNAFGTVPLRVGGAHVALRQQEAAVVPGSDRALTFGGRATVTIPAGAVLVSDPVDLTVPPLADLAVDIYLPGDTADGPSPLTSHTGALQTSYVSTPGDHSGASAFPVMATVTSWFFLARVEVTAPAAAAAVVTLGDSITDGARSTVDTNNRWPDHLARALARRGAGVSVLNMGIAGNRVLSDGNGVGALARFDRDVLAAPGVTHVIVMEGINDLGGGLASADDLIAAHKQIIERAHARGLRVIGATLTPIEDTTFQGYYTPEHEAARQAVNRWIRTGGAYDGVIDFDAVLRDGARQTKLQLPFASSDFIHPNDAGYQAMAGAIDLRLLGVRGATKAPR